MWVFFWNIVQQFFSEQLWAIAERIKLSKLTLSIVIETDYPMLTLRKSNNKIFKNIRPKLVKLKIH